VALRVEGLRELRTAFAVAGNGMAKDLDAALKSSAEPVKRSAETLAVSRIPKMHITRSGVPWDTMRIGITRHTVYVAPANRRGRYRRRNLFDLLMDRSLSPALEENRGRVEQEVKDAVRDMGRAWERVPGANQRGVF
jgi:hypothetical protein